MASTTYFGMSIRRVRRTAVTDPVVGLLAEASAATIRAFGVHQGRHVRTVRDGVMHMRHGMDTNIDKRVLKKVMDLDHAYKIARHVIEAYVAEVLRDLEREVEQVYGPPRAQPVLRSIPAESSGDFVAAMCKDAVAQVHDRIDSVHAKLDLLLSGVEKVAATGGMPAPSTDETHHENHRMEHHFDPFFLLEGMAADSPVSTPRATGGRQGHELGASVV